MHTLNFEDNDHLRELVGEFGRHLKMVSRALEVEVTQRGSQVRVGGQAAELACRVLEELYELIEAGHPLHTTDVDHAIRILAQRPDATLQTFFRDTVLVGTGNRPITPRSVGQVDYVEALRASDVVFAVGPAGTGKTYLAMAMAVSSLLKGDVKRIILTRPAVEAGEKLGFLPGDLSDKVDPYLRPLYDALHDMLPTNRIARLIERNIIEVAPLAFMRGRTLNQAYAILDEAQNTTVEQMKMFLTRLGTSSRMVITGDITQIDLPRGKPSGMVDALRVLAGLERIGVVHLTARDVVRHPLVSEIIDAYEVEDQRRRAAEHGDEAGDQPADGPDEEGG